MKAPLRWASTPQIHKEQHAGRRKTKCTVFCVAAKLKGKYDLAKIKVTRRQVPGNGSPLPLSPPPTAPCKGATFSNVRFMFEVAERRGAAVWPRNKKDFQQSGNCSDTQKFGFYSSTKRGQESLAAIKKIFTLSLFAWYI